MSYFDKLGDKLRHLHIVDSDASDTHYIRRGKSRCGTDADILIGAEGYAQWNW